MSDAEGQPKKRITLSLPPDVYKAVKVFGAHTGQTNQAILEAALAEYLAREEVSWSLHQTPSHKLRRTKEAGQ